MRFIVYLLHYCVAKGGLVENKVSSNKNVQYYCVCSVSWSKKKENVLFLQ